MIVVDSSALIAIFEKESDAAIYAAAIEKEDRLHEALSAYDRYGKGIEPKARLNLCDCAAYALARTMDAPLLFKGYDFTHTNLKSCL